VRRIHHTGLSAVWQYSNRDETRDTESQHDVREHKQGCETAS
jgi:hypothetical protein